MSLSKNLIAAFVASHSFTDVILFNKLQAKKDTCFYNFIRETEPQCYTVQVCDATKASYLFKCLLHKNLMNCSYKAKICDLSTAQLLQEYLSLCFVPLNLMKQNQACWHYNRYAYYKFSHHSLPGPFLQPVLQHASGLHR